MTDITTTVLTDDQIRISLRHLSQPGRRRALIICPGFFQSKETRVFRQMSETLASVRDIIAMDFRGHGRSDGWYTFSAKEPADLAAVLRWAGERYQQLDVMGFSLGAAIAITTVSRQPQHVRSVMAVSAPCAFGDIEFKWWAPDAMRNGIHGLDRFAGCRPGSIFLPKERPIEHVHRLAPIPICFLHGTRDVIIGVEHSRRLYQTAADPKRLCVIEGGSHAQALFRDDPAGFLRIVNGWLAS